MRKQTEESKSAVVLYAIFERRYYLLTAITAVVGIGATWLFWEHMSDTLTYFVTGCLSGLMFCCAIFHFTMDYPTATITTFAWIDKLVETAQQYEFRKALPAKYGCVYLLRDVDVTGYYKIGKTTRPVDRIGRFDVELPFEVHIIHIIKTQDCTTVETVLHRKFADKRVRGEWFALSDDDVKWVQGMESA